MSPAPIIAVVSGKGGVGKTHLVTNLAVASASLGARVLLVDGDLGLANVDVFLGLIPDRTVADVLDGRCEFEEAIVVGPRGLRILPAASGRADLPALDAARLARLIVPLAEAARTHDLIFLDVGAGIGPAVVGLAGASTRALLVMTSEPASLTDAYAMVKVLEAEAPGLSIEVVVNEADSELQARETHARLDRMARRFLERGLDYGSWLPRDRRAAQAAARQRALVEAFPSSVSSKRIVRMAQQLLRETRPSRRGHSRVRPTPEGLEVTWKRS